jgi:hypothetical protein
LLKNIEHEIFNFPCISPQKKKQRPVVEPMVRYACSSARSRPMIYV